MSNIPDEELSQDMLFSLLSNPRRRFVLQYLNRTTNPVTLQDLATEVAAWENETDPESLTDKQQKRLYVSLYQTHIPKLEEAGIIEYDSDSGEITLTDQAGDLNKHLNGDVEESRRPWERYYLGLALTAVVVYAAVALAPGLGGIWTSLVGLVFVLALAAVALIQYAQT